MFSMSGLYFSLRQRNVLILLTTNHPTPLLFCNLYCLMDSTFLRILAVPSNTDFCKAPTLYDIPNLFKLHSKSFGMDPSAPIIIGTIKVFLSHILVISNRSSEWLSNVSESSYSESSYYQRDMQHQLSNIFWYSFP